MAKRRRQPTTRDVIFVELCATLGTGRLHEAYISSNDPTERVDGLCVSGKVVVNPVYHVVETLMHECVHRIRPEWSERSVRRKTTQVMRQLNDGEIQRVYDVWLSHRKVAKRPVKLSGDDTLE